MFSKELISLSLLFDDFFIYLSYYCYKDKVLKDNRQENILNECRIAEMQRIDRILKKIEN